MGAVAPGAAPPAAGASAPEAVGAPPVGVAPAGDALGPVVPPRGSPPVVCARADVAARAAQAPRVTATFRAQPPGVWLMGARIYHTAPLTPLGRFAGSTRHARRRATAPRHVSSPRAIPRASELCHR